jgi:hypothetical protein
MSENVEKFTKAGVLYKRGSISGWQGRLFILKDKTCNNGGDKLNCSSYVEFPLISSFQNSYRVFSLSNY